MKIQVNYTVNLTDHEVTEMLREANIRGYLGSDTAKLRWLLWRDGTCAIDSVPPKTKLLESLRESVGGTGDVAPVKQQ